MNIAMVPVKVVYYVELLRTQRAFEVCAHGIMLVSQMPWQIGFPAALVPLECWVAEVALQVVA